MFYKKPNRKHSYKIQLLLLFSVISPFLTLAQEMPPEVIFSVRGFVVEGDNQVDPQTTADVLADFTGDHSGLDGLVEAAAALEQLLAEAGFSFHKVILPPQTLQDGTITLKVVAFNLGSIKVIGNHHYDEGQVIRSLPALSPGSTPNTQAIARTLGLANRHPGRSHLISIKQGEAAETVDVDVRVKDQKPWQVFTGINNIGTDLSGHTRLTAGAQHHNLFGFDDSAAISYTTSHQQPQEVKQYGLSYTLPLYRWASSLNLFYSSSDVDSGEINSLQISGAGQFLGVSLTHLLLRQGNYTHEINIGLTDKLFENDALFVGVNLAADVRSRPLSIGYSGQYQTRLMQLSFSTTATTNTGAGSRNADTDYAANRAGAEQSWQRFNASASINFIPANGWMFRGIFEGQYSEDPLISGEQFGLGGMNSIRGFEERAVSGDSGLRLSVETWLPTISKLPGVRLLGFIDYGYFDRQAVQPGEENSDNLVSAGFGGRWNWRQNINLSVDYGYVLNQAEHLQGTTGDPGNARWHVNLYTSY